VSRDLSEWQFQLDVCNLLNRQLLPQLKPSREGSLEDVKLVFAALQSYIQGADQSLSKCAQRLKLSLQGACDRRTPQQADADVIQQWIICQRDSGKDASYYMQKVHCD
jgi:hypothetical protein